MDVDDAGGKIKPQRGVCVGKKCVFIHSFFVVAAFIREEERRDVVLLYIDDTAGCVCVTLGCHVWSAFVAGDV